MAWQGRGLTSQEREVTNKEGARIPAVYERCHELMYLGPKIGNIAHPDYLNHDQQSSCNGHRHCQQLWIHKQRRREQA